MRFSRRDFLRLSSVAYLAPRNVFAWLGTPQTTHLFTPENGLSATAYGPTKTVVSLNPAAVGAETFTLPLGEEVFRTMPLLPGDFTVRGKYDYTRRFLIEGADASSHLTVFEGCVEADIYTPRAGESFRLVVTPDGFATLQGIREAPLECHCVPFRASAAATALKSRRRAVRSGAPIPPVRLMVVYEAAAMTHEGSALAIETHIRSKVDSLNLIIRESGVGGVSFELVHVGLTHMTSVGNGVKNLQLVAEDGPTAALRKQVGADAVLFCTSDGPSTTFVPVDDPDFSWDIAFGVIGIKSFGDFTLEHESGHLLGLQHDLLNVPAIANKPRQYARGYRSIEGNFRTVMAVTPGPATAPLPRIPRFSNLATTYQSFATGTEAENNARQIPDGAFRITQYHQFL